MKGQVIRLRYVCPLAVAIGLGAAPVAWAADIPSRPPVLKAAPIAAANWTGFYVNGGLGYGLWAADTSVALVPGSGNVALPFMQRQGGKGYLGVIGGGFDYQFSPRLVGGVFADFDFASLKGTVQDQGPFFGGDIKETSAWAVGARGGYLINPERLTYVNAGYTNARFSSAQMVNTITLAPRPFSTPEFSRGGYFIGGGMETALFANWYWRTEYRLAYYGNQVLTDTTSTGVFVNNINFKPTVQTITAQLVYKYNPGIAGAVTDAPVPSGPASWTGVYVNGGAGYGIWAADTTVTAVPGSGLPPLPFKQRQGGKGYLGTVGGGFDYQFMPRVIGGVFADFDFASLKGTVQDQGPFFAGDIKETRAWAAGVRAGWLFTPDVLSYVNAGYTNAHFSSAQMVSTVTLVPTGFSTPAFSSGGYFLGGGVEAALTGGWFWRNGYRVAYYGNHVLTDTNGATFVNNISFKPTVQTVTSQLVYKFNWTR
jgi:outer membrane immunogenic protein